MKIIRHVKYGEILGADIVGAHATELIHELAVARENECTVEEIELAIHAHPTLSEAIAEATLDAMGRMIHAQGEAGGEAVVSPPLHTQNPAESINVVNRFPLAGFGVNASPERSVWLSWNCTF